MKPLLLYPKTPAMNFILTIRAASWFVAAFVAYILIMESYENQMPANSWFTPVVHVPDFKVPDDPLVSYKQDIQRDFTARWTVRMIDSSTGTYLCSGFGESGYSKGTRDFSMTLNYFMNPIPPCHIKPGSYVLKVDWRMRDERGREKVQHRTSNIFTVR